MIYRHHVPAPPLSEFVELLWLFDGYAPGQARERLLPMGTVELVVNLRENQPDFRDLIVAGPRSEYSVLDTAHAASVARPDGSIGHAEVRIGDSMVMLGQARDEWKARPGTLYLYVPDVDATYRRALAAGGASLREPTTQVYGDRSGGVEDPVGNQWWMATHVEDVSPEEIDRRANPPQK
jgi:PhnB protein